MPNSAQDMSSYDVSVEHGSLRLLESSGALAKYGVRLTGGIDPRWAESFRVERRLSRALSRFELDAETSTVWFTRETGGDPADVIEALDLLDSLVARLNVTAPSRPLTLQEQETGSRLN